MTASHAEPPPDLTPWDERLWLGRQYRRNVPKENRTPVNAMTLVDLRRRMRPQSERDVLGRWTAKYLDGGRRLGRAPPKPRASIHFLPRHNAPDPAAVELASAQRRLIDLFLPESLGLAVACWLCELQNAEQGAWYRYLGRCSRRRLAPDMSLWGDTSACDAAAKKERSRHWEHPSIEYLRCMVRSLVPVEGPRFAELADRAWSAADANVVRRLFTDKNLFPLRRPLGWRLNPGGYGYFPPPDFEMMDVLDHMTGSACRTKQRDDWEWRGAHWSTRRTRGPSGVACTVCAPGSVEPWVPSWAEIIGSF